LGACTALKKSRPMVAIGRYRRGRDTRHWTGNQNGKLGVHAPSTNVQDTKKKRTDKVYKTKGTHKKYLGGGGCNEH